MSYPYSTATGSITKILSKIQTVGQPAKADKKWLSSIGFTKDSDHRVLAILKFIGFAEKNGAPTQLWKDFKATKTGKSALGTAIKTSYSELYKTYPNAHEASKEDLTNFFSTNISAGSLVLTHTVNTFKKLAEYAEFSASASLKAEASLKDYPITTQKSQPQPNKELDGVSKQFGAQGGKVTVNLNIQLTVPDTTDQKVFDNFFESMKKHLLS